MSNDAGAAAPIWYRYRFGSAEFDEATFELRVSGLRVDVERRALEVLAYLLRHAGEVVTKEELFREVWAGRVTVDKVLPNAITKLRRALGEANAELLLTQPRVGYRLNATVERSKMGRKLASQLQLGAGQAVPGRKNFVLQRQLGGSHGGEVWLAEHAKTHERRVYKFGVDGERLRALKREATLSRVLQEGLEDREHFVELIDWNFESAPFFLECEYGGESLYDWSREGLGPLSTEARLGLFLQIADAVAAAHGVGVLHKDLKPANVLIAGQEDGWRIRLTDFGSGRLLDPERLEELGITQFGLTATQSIGTDSSTGTPLYVAPEVFAGHAPTVQSDVYALGILLYQMLAGDLSRPMASGWEQDIGDELVREDIRLATDGNPARRLAGAGELAARLRSREARHAQAQRLREDEAQARIAREQLAKSRARRPYLVALVGALLLGVIVSFGFYRDASRARDAAQRELERANAINRFLEDDLISRANPFVAAKGAGATLKDVLLSAQDRIAERFDAQPATEASIRTNLAGLFSAIGLHKEAETAIRRGLALYEREEGPTGPGTLKARSLLAGYLTKTSTPEASLAELNVLDAATSGTTDPAVKYRVASAWMLYYMNQKEYEKGLEQCRNAIALLRRSGPDDTAAMDNLRSNVVIALTGLGRFDEAKREAQALVDDIAARPGDQKLQLAFARQMLGKAHSFAGESDAAGKLFAQAEGPMMELLGPQHSRTLGLLSDLSYLEFQRGDLDKALHYAQLGYEGVRARFGDDSPHTYAALLPVGQFRYEHGDLPEAEATLTLVRRRLGELRSPDNTDTQYATFFLAATKIDLKKFDEAARLLDTIDEEGLKTGGEDQLWKARLDALHGLVKAATDPKAAIPLLQSAVAGYEQQDAAQGGTYERARKALAQLQAAR